VESVFVLDAGVGFLVGVNIHLLTVESEVCRDGSLIGLRVGQITTRAVWDVQVPSRVMLRVVLLRANFVGPHN
jgi:hypothetical protein